MPMLMLRLPQMLLPSTAATLDHEAVAVTDVAVVSCLLFLCMLLLLMLGLVPMLLLVTWLP